MNQWFVAGVDLILTPEDAFMRIKDTAFLSLRLNVRTDAGWAVVGQASGAVALDAQGKLLMKLTRTKAEQIAKTMTEASLVTSS